MKQGPISHQLNTPLGEICWFEWGQAGQGPTLLLLHATGFHARLWDQVVAHLPDDYHVVAVDHLGHGRSHKPATMADWTDSCRALLPLVDHLTQQNGGAPLVGCGHSMGGYVLALLAAQRPQAFRHILLIDPVIFAPEFYTGAHHIVPDPADHPVSKRRNHWDSAEQMQAHFSQRKPYATWQPDVLADYCQYGLLPADDDGNGGGLVLACPPLLEASIYQNAQRSSPYDVADQIRADVTVIRAKVAERAGEMDFSASPTWPQAAAHLNHGRDIFWPEHSHFIPMEAPEKVAAMLVSIAAQPASSAP
jgi:lipase